jgi:hypothetical protein
LKGINLKAEPAVTAKILRKNEDTGDWKRDSKSRWCAHTQEGKLEAILEEN